MPKQKTHKGLVKRMKVTGRGKVMRKQAGMSHLMSGTGGNSRRSLRKTVQIHKTVAKKTLNLMG